MKLMAQFALVAAPLLAFAELSAISPKLPYFGAESALTTAYKQKGLNAESLEYKNVDDMRAASNAYGMYAGHMPEFAIAALRDKEPLPMQLKSLTSMIFSNVVGAGKIDDLATYWHSSRKFKFDYNHPIIINALEIGAIGNIRGETRIASVPVLIVALDSDSEAFSGEEAIPKIIELEDNLLGSDFVKGSFQEIQSHHRRTFLYAYPQILQRSYTLTP